MIKGRLIGLASACFLSTFALFFNGCGGGGGSASDGSAGGGSGGSGGSPITNPTQSAQSAMIAFQAFGMAAESLIFRNDLTDSVLDKECVSQGSCSFGGSYTCTPISQTEFKYTFSNCREGNWKLNGPVYVKRTESESSFQAELKYGDQSTQFTVYEYSNNNLVSEMTMRLTINYSGSESTIKSTMNGQVNTLDYTQNPPKNYQLELNNLQSIASITCNNQDCSNPSSGTITFNGGLTATKIENNESVSISYSNFKISVVSTSQYEDISLDGTFNVDFTPNICFEGSFVLRTISPLRLDKSQPESSEPISGHLLINDNTHTEILNSVDIVWYDANGNGRKDPGEEISNWGELAKQCGDFYDFVRED